MNRDLLQVQKLLLVYILFKHVILKIRMSENRHRKSVNVIRSGIFPVLLQNHSAFQMSRGLIFSHWIFIRLKYQTRGDWMLCTTIRGLRAVRPRRGLWLKTSFSFLWFSLFQLTKSITVFGIFFIHKWPLLKISVWVKKLKIFYF